MRCSKESQPICRRLQTTIFPLIESRFDQGLLNKQASQRVRDKYKGPMNLRRFQPSVFNIVQQRLCMAGDWNDGGIAKNT